VHSVLERVRVMTDEGPHSAWVIATNVYLQTARGWRLVAHHASPGSQREVQEMVEAGSTIH
jgi:ketosteroid isomerase-like protein